MSIAYAKGIMALTVLISPRLFCYHTNVGELKGGNEICPDCTFGRSGRPDCGPEQAVAAGEHRRRQHSQERQIGQSAHQVRPG